MPHESVPPDDSPHELLTAVRDLTHRVVVAQRGTWFPLLIFAAITLAAIPVYKYVPHHLGTCRSGPRGTFVCAAILPGVLVYWPIALVLAYAAIAAFYIRRSWAQGIETRVRPYAIAGAIIAVALTGAALWEANHPSASGLVGLSGVSHRLASPACAIGLALLVLAWAERNRALLLLTIAYLAVVLLGLGFVGVHDPGSLLAFLPLIIDGSVLLLGGIGFAAAQRPLWSPAP
jgi:hypothetical protein